MWFNIGFCFFPEKINKFWTRSSIPVTLTWYYAVVQIGRSYRKFLPRKNKNNTRFRLAIERSPRISLNQSHINMPGSVCQPKSSIDNSPRFCRASFTLANVTIDAPKEKHLSLFMLYLIHQIVNTGSQFFDSLAYSSELLKRWWWCFKPWNKMLLLRPILSMLLK